MCYKPVFQRGFRTEGVKGDSGIGEERGDEHGL